MPCPEVANLARSFFGYLVMSLVITFGSLQVKPLSFEQVTAASKICLSLWLVLAVESHTPPSYDLTKNKKILPVSWSTTYEGSENPYLFGFSFPFATICIFSKVFPPSLDILWTIEFGLGASYALFGR